jgi:dipeptidyl aminopeptidase/acylaminoacyl peptidase
LAFRSSPPRYVPSWTALLALCALLSNAISRAVPLEVYGRLPSLEDVSLSPDGSRIAFVRTTADERTIEVLSLAGRKGIGGLRAGEQKVRSIRWADNDHLLVITSSTSTPFGLLGTEHEWYMLQVYDVTRHRTVALPDTSRLFGARFMNVISGTVTIRRVSGRTYLFLQGFYVQGRALPAFDRLPVLIRVDLESGAERVTRLGTAATQYWLVDANGEVAAEQQYSDQDQRWSVRVRHGNRLDEAISGSEAIDYPRLIGFGPTTETLLVQGVEGGDPVWRLFALKDGTLGPPMQERKTLTTPIEDRLSARLVGGVHIDDDWRYVFFDDGMQKQWDAIVRTFGSARVRLVSSSEDFRRVIVRVDGAQYGYRYVLIDLDKATAEPVGDVYAGVTQPLEVRRINYAAADGLQIPGYLTLPAGRAPTHLPLIVLPHGGPASRDTADFGWWPQALAAQGYAVLQPNYRGSELDDRPFLAAGFGQWGRKMQTDLSDGVRYLVREGIVDPGRVCIVGASYGGYAALAGPALDPGVYRCAVAVAGMSDLKRMLEWVNDKHFTRSSLEQRYWDRFMGVGGPNDSALDSISPIKHVATVAVPILLMHGRDDTIVPYEQSELMYTALRHAGKEVELVTLNHEDHWLSRSETRLQMLQSSIDFLRAHNPPDP